MTKQSMQERLKPYGWADENPIFGSVNAAVLRLKTKAEVKQFFREYIMFLRQRDDIKTEEQARNSALENIAFFITRAIIPEVQEAIEVASIRGGLTGHLETDGVMETFEKSQRMYNSLQYRENLFTRALPELERYLG